MDANLNQGWRRAIGHPTVLMVLLSVLGLRVLDHFLGVLPPTVWRWLLALVLLATAVVLFLGRHETPKIFGRLPRYDRVVSVVCVALVAAAGATIFWPVPTGLTSSVQIDLDSIVENGTPLGGTYLIPAPIADVDPPPRESDTCVGRYGWATEQGGVVAESQTVRLTVRRTSDAPIHITRFTPIRVKAESPLLGSVIGCGGQGGNVPVRRIDIALSKGDVTWEYVGSEQDDNKAFAFAVDKETPLVFDLHATALDCDCSWVAEIGYRQGTEKRERTLRIDNDGAPFRASAADNAVRYQRISGQWVERPSSDDGADGSGVDACDLLPRTTVERVLGIEAARGDRGEFSTQPGLGGNPLQVSSCNFAFGEADDLGGRSLVGAILSVAADADVAGDEAEIFRTATAGGASWVQVPDLGYEAYVRDIDGAVQARRGRETISVFIAPTEVARGRTGQVMELAREAVRTAWG